VISTRAVLTECGVLGLFIIGLLLSYRYKRWWHPTEIIAMYSLGLLFEVLTAYMWIYHNIIFVFPFEIDHDISVFFPLGWAGMIIIATTLTETLWTAIGVRKWWSRHVWLSAVWLVFGGLTEITFHKIGMIEYVRDERTGVNFLLGQMPGMPPTMVLLFYGILPPLISQYFRWAERGLARRPRTSRRIT